MTDIPAVAQKWLDDPEFATVATVEPDGQPQVSVIWVKRDGNDVLFSTVRGRRKTVNLERDPRATVVVFPADSPYHYVELRGRVTLEDDPEGKLINELSHEYTGKEWTKDAPGTPRVIVRLTPAKVVVH